MRHWKEIPRDNWRVVLGIGLIIFGAGLNGRFFFPWHNMDAVHPAVIPSLVRFVTYGGAIVTLLGAAALMGRR